MSKWNKVSKERRERILAYNRQKAADAEAANDMRFVAERIATLPKGQRKKLLTEELLSVLAKYGVEV